MEALANNLKRLREEKGITQKELAEKLNSSASRISMYEQNRREPDLQTIIKIANLFNCSIDYLLGINKKKLVTTDELTKILPEEKILLSSYKKINDDDRHVLWALLDKYLTATEKEYFSQYNAGENIS